MLKIYFSLVNTHTMTTVIKVYYAVSKHLYKNIIFGQIEPENQDLFILCEHHG
jgi:hypothetical protein